MTSFPFEKMWSFQNVEHQISMELSYFNWYLIVQEPQKAFWAFANLLMKILYLPPTEEPTLQINTEDAKQFLALYFGKKNPQNNQDRGLYALDIIERETTEKYAILCRGYGDELKPNGHHGLVMLIYQDLWPLLWKLWHQIASQVDTKGGSMMQLKTWLEDRDQLPTEEEVEAQLTAQGLLKLAPVMELMEIEE